MRSGQIILGSRRAVIGTQRILIEPGFTEPKTLTSPIVAIIKQEYRQSPLVEELQILETVNIIAGAAMAPDCDQRICLRLDAAELNNRAPSAA